MIRRNELEKEEVVEVIIDGGPRVRTGRRIHRIASDQVGFDDDRRLEHRRRRMNSRLARNEDFRGGREKRGECGGDVRQRRVEVGRRRGKGTGGKGGVDLPPP